jgi:hypothetical protein
LNPGDDRWLDPISLVIALLVAVTVDAYCRTAEGRLVSPAAGWRGAVMHHGVWRCFLVPSSGFHPAVLTRYERQDILLRWTAPLWTPADDHRATPTGPLKGMPNGTLFNFNFHRLRFDGLGETETRRNRAREAFNGRFERAFQQCNGRLQTWFFGAESGRD